MTKKQPEAEHCKCHTHCPTCGKAYAPETTWRIYTVPNAGAAQPQPWWYIQPGTVWANTTGPKTAAQYVHFATTF